MTFCALVHDAETGSGEGVSAGSREGVQLKSNAQNILLLAMVLCFTPTNAQVRKTVSRGTTPSHAIWSPPVEKFLGLTHQQFDSSGVYKLTPDEFGKLYVAISQIRDDAVTQAQKSDGSYDCAPTLICPPFLVHR